MARGIVPPKYARFYRDQHICGYPLATIYSEADREYLLHDDKPDSPTYREVVDCCPGCGAPLLSHMAEMIAGTLTKRRE